MTNLDYLYNPDAAKDAFNKNYFLDKKLGFQIIENGMILPYSDTRDDGKKNFVGFGGIVYKNGEFIRESFIHVGTGGAYIPPPESIQHSSETVIYFGISYRIWGHCLTDNIRRLWFLKSDFFRKEFKNCPIVYIAWRNRDIGCQKNFRRLLEILEVDVDRFQVINQPTQFERIILPDESFFIDDGARKFTNEYRNMIEQVRMFALKNCSPTACKKIYYLYNREQLGEERLAEYFKSKGYEIVRPETLTFDEQLNLLINCESFASTVGSCSHNSIFLRDNMEVILIPRFSQLIADYQEPLNQVHPVNAIYVDSSLSIFGKVHEPFCYIISPQLKRFFGDNWDGYEEEDFKTFLQYIKNCMERGLKIHPSTWTHYEKIFYDFMVQLKRREDLISAYDISTNYLDTFRPTLTYQTHVHYKGWRDGWRSENEFSNPLDQMLDIQAIKINFPNHKVYYSVYYNEKEGWSEEVTAPDMAGITGKSKAIMGIKIRLDEAGAKDFDILYRVHKFDGEWTDWAKNGENLYSYGQKINAVQVKLEFKS